MKPNQAQFRKVPAKLTITRPHAGREADPVIRIQIRSSDGPVLVGRFDGHHSPSSSSPSSGSGSGTARFHHASARQLRDKRGRPVSRPEREA